MIGNYNIYVPPHKITLVTTTTILMLNYFLFVFNAHVTENIFDWLR